MRQGTALFCDHCGQEKMLVIRPLEGLEARNRDHGRHHAAIMRPRDILEALTGTVDGSAILSRVQSLVL